MSEAADSRKRFLEKFRILMVPILKLDGFVGSGTNFRRRNGKVIQALCLQGSKWGGSCCIELGIHLAFFPILGDAGNNFEKIKAPQCEFRSRMCYPAKGDTWWEYGKSDEEAESAVLDLKKTYLDVGRDRLNLFYTFPDDFCRVTPQDFNQNNFSDFAAALCPPSLYGEIRMLLAQARIHHHLGDRENAAQFAELGLKKVGPAVGLKAEFEKLRSL